MTSIGNINDWIWSVLLGIGHFPCILNHLKKSSFVFAIVSVLVRANNSLVATPESKNYGQQLNKDRIQIEAGCPLKHSLKWNRIFKSRGSHEYSLYMSIFLIDFNNSCIVLKTFFYTWFYNNQYLLAIMTVLFSKRE